MAVEARGGTSGASDQPSEAAVRGIWVRSCRAAIRSCNSRGSVRSCRCRIRSCNFLIVDSAAAVGVGSFVPLSAMGAAEGMAAAMACACSIRSASQRSCVGSTISLRRRRSSISCVRGATRVAIDAAAVADQGGERGQAGPRLLAALRARQHRILDRAQPHLPPGREHQLLDQMRLGRVHGLPAGRAARRAGPRARDHPRPRAWPGRTGRAGWRSWPSGPCPRASRGRATGRRCGGRSRRDGRRIAGRAWAGSVTGRSRRSG